MVYGVKSTVRPKRNSILFALAVTEIACKPKRSRHSRRIKLVNTGDTHSLSQELVRELVRIVQENHSTMIGLRFQPCLMYDVIGARCSRARIRGQLQIIADG